MRRLSIVLVGLIISGCVAASPSTQPPTSSAGSVATSASPTAEPTPSPSALARYPDGIPDSFDGQPVLRGAAVIAKAKAMTTDDPFLVGAWLDVKTGGSRSCPIETRSLPPDSWLWACPGPLVRASDEAGSGLSVLVDPFLHSNPTATFRFAPDLRTGPAILRVHVHDPRAVQCGADEATCDSMIVVESAVWAGDAATEPGPISVDAALAAIRRVVPTTTLRPLGDSDMRSYGNELPSGRSLQAPSLSLGADSDAFVVSAAVLPSSEALHRALPEVTPGAAGALLTTSVAGEWGGSDPKRKWWFVDHWLVVENVAVLVSMLRPPSVLDRQVVARLADELTAGAASPPS